VDKPEGNEKDLASTCKKLCPLPSSSVLTSGQSLWRRIGKPGGNLELKQDREFQRKPQRQERTGLEGTRYDFQTDEYNECA
jgi:hypothetical protein